jgi:Histidine phosphatase superfamily (branch 1)
MACKCNIIFYIACIYPNKLFIQINEMKKASSISLYYILPIFLFVAILLSACTSTIYIVRHAEKSTEPKSDPHLTAQGKKRAIALKELLKDKKIKQIFSTNTNRTKETATPISNINNVPIDLYNNDTTINFYKYIFLSKKNTLVVGHSNTVLKMLDSVGLHPKIKLIGDTQYDNLFIVKVKKYCAACKNPFKAKLFESKYGMPSDVDSVTSMMK